MNINLLRERPFRGSFTVSELNNYVKGIFDGDRTLASVSVKGEISNFTYHRSGHLYFSLKDADGQIRAVMFRSSAASLKFMPEDGMKVVAHGSVSVYTRDGSYQLYVNSLVPDGIGALYLAYEQLKAKLEGEGLFDSSYKKTIPRYPEKIGIITSATGAAIRDIINVTGRRYPLAAIYLYPAIVQGDGAEESLIKALEFFDSSGLVDTVIIGRGGGSIEDLWAFNSEKLARRIFEAKVPIISAVGHETDFTICDFVADRRAPTPSAAAELAVPDVRELLQYTDSMAMRLRTALVALLTEREMLLKRLENAEVIRKPSRIADVLYDRLSSLKDAVSRAYNERLKREEQKLALNTGMLEALSPLSVLSRGYSLVEKNGRLVNSIALLTEGENIDVVLKDGRAGAKIVSLRKDNSKNEK